jgi:radical SAM PhpK family P-methyltransferase
MAKRALDCIVIGYNETPFPEYERLIRRYGEDSEAYRDLKLSFVDLGERGGKVTYIGLLNEAVNAAYGLPRGSETFKSGDIPNLAAVYLTQYLRRKGLAAEYVNLFQYEKERLLELLAEKPACVAITTTFYVLNLPVTEMTRFLKEHAPDVPVVVGGPLVANHARSYSGTELETALADTGADLFVHESQGEATLAEAVLCLRGGGDLSKVPNLIYFENGKLRANPREPEVNSLDDNALDWRDLAAGRSLGPTLQTRTARSCAFSCAFCNYPTRAGKLTLADLGSVEAELDSMRELGAVRNVVFIDDTFNVPVTRFKDLCRMMIRKGYGFDWYSYFRCSNADQECVELAAESGCKGVFLGIESGSPAILKNMNKAATIEKYARGIEWLRGNGILTFGSFITGFPGETDETAEETADFIRQTRPDYFRSQMWYCEPGTPIFGQRDAFGIEGEGFVWRHKTMESLDAMDHIERLFLSVKGSEWLPQWSFDFWIIPYLTGRGISRERFHAFMGMANRLQALEIAAVEPREREAARAEAWGGMVGLVKSWGLAVSGAAG